MTKKFLLYDKTGVYLKRNQHGVLDLLESLSGLSLRDVGSEHIEICRTIREDRVFAVLISEIPKDVEKATLNTKLSWAAYHSITIFEVKAQLSQVAETFKEGGPEREYTYKLIGVLERIFSRGLEYKSWIKEGN